MPEQLDEQATDTVRRLLYENVVAANMAGYDPTLPRDDANSLPIHYGNYVASYPDPQISIGQPQGEFTVDGDRWSGKRNDGGFNQYRRGQILVQCWASADEAPYNNGLDAPDILALIRPEVERVMGGYELGPDAGANAGVIWSFSTQWEGRFSPDATDDPNPTWQSQVVVTYDWERET